MVVTRIMVVLIYIGQIRIMFETKCIAKLLRAFDDF